MARRERDILERAVPTIAEQAAKADELVDEAKAAGGGDHPVTIRAKMLRLELLKVKADLERELETWVPNCTKCGLDVHWVSASASYRPLGAPRTGAARPAFRRLHAGSRGLVHEPARAPVGVARSGLEDPDLDRRGHLVRAPGRSVGPIDEPSQPLVLVPTQPPMHRLA